MRTLLRALMLIALAPLLTGLAGCQPDPQVKTQDAPRLPMERCIGAIVFPRGEASDKIWMFKVVGPELEVDNFKLAFDKFILEDLSFLEGDQLVWNLPKGWTKKNDKQAISNLLADKIEIVVMQRKMRRPKQDVDPKSLAGGKKPAQREEAFMVYNVDQRVDSWRRELGLAGGIADYFYEPKRLASGDKRGMAFLVNTVGPHHMELPVTEFLFTLPDGWEEAMPRAMGDIQMPLAIRIQDGNKRANFTLTRAGGSVAANIDRWRDQVGLEPLGDEAKMNLRDIVVDGIKGKYVDLIRPKEADKPGRDKSNPHAMGMERPKEERILGVIVTRNNDQWFFKLSGPIDVLDRNKRKFEDFLERFAFTE